MTGGGVGMRYGKSIALLHLLSKRVIRSGFIVVLKARTGFIWLQIRVASIGASTPATELKPSGPGHSSLLSGALPCD